MSEATIRRLSSRGKTVTQEENNNSLPQPPDGRTYHYLLTLDIATRIFKQEPHKPPSFQPDQLVWVCKSKGLRNNNNNKNKRGGRNQQQQVSTNTKHLTTQQLFLRARVVADEESNNNNKTPVDDVNNNTRIRVRYPQGSTYACQPHRLLPILENNTDNADTDAQNLILVAAETSDYRRTCVVHTLPTDHFLEVGCDFGCTTERVYQNGVGAVGRVPHTRTTRNSNHIPPPPPRMVVGVDKSAESIGMARQRYPHLTFAQCDILQNDIRQVLPDFSSSSSLVMAVDINGTRELPAVCQCLQVLLMIYQPRLVIVKSRALFAKLEESP